MNAERRARFMASPRMRAKVGAGSSRFVTIMINETCPLRCRHCSVGFGEAFTGTNWEMSTDDLRGLVSAIDPGIYDHVLFAGGEPSVSRKLLQVGVEAAHANHLQAGMVSAPIWARDLAAARRFLESVPVDWLTLSFDDYHLEFLKVQHYENAIAAARERGIVLAVNACYANPAELVDLASRVTELGVFRVNFTPVLPVGNALQMQTETAAGAVKIQAGDDIRRLRRSCSIGNPLVMPRPQAREVAACCWAADVWGAPIAHRVFRSAEELRVQFDTLEEDPAVRHLLGHGLIDGWSDESAAEVARCVDGMAFVSECDLCAHLMRPENRVTWDKYVAQLPAPASGGPV